MAQLRQIHGYPAGRVGTPLQGRVSLEELLRHHHRLLRPCSRDASLLPNDDPDHYFRMSVLQGLYQSINTITFQSAAQLDFCNIQKMATAAGVVNGHTNQPYDLSSIASLIGTQDVAPLSMADAYATFAASGVHCDPIALESVTGPARPDLSGARRATAGRPSTPMSRPG